jgi:hypothetical protein
METAIIIEEAVRPKVVAVSVNLKDVNVKRAEIIEWKLEKWMRMKLRFLFKFGMVSYKPSKEMIEDSLFLIYEMIWLEDKTKYEKPRQVDRAYFQYHEYRSAEARRAVATEERRNHPLANVV